MVSHGPVSAAVIFCFAWTGLALVNNVSLKQRPGWSYAELTLFCWGEQQDLRVHTAWAFADLQPKSFHSLAVDVNILFSNSWFLCAQ